VLGREAIEMLKKDFPKKARLRLSRKERVLLLVLAAGLVIVVGLALYLASHSGSSHSLSSPAHAPQQPVHGD
jgi:cell division protein FtsL